jgi:hypothetical protein
MAHLQTDGARVFSLWHNEGVTSHPKRPRDPAQLAKLMIDIASGGVEDRELTPEDQGKDPAAVKRGRLGGAKGGKARAAKMTIASEKPARLKRSRQMESLIQGEGRMTTLAGSSDLG